MTHVHIVHYILSVSLRPQSLQVHCRQEIPDVPANYVTRDCKKANVHGVRKQLCVRLVFSALFALETRHKRENKTKKRKSVL